MKNYSEGLFQVNINRFQLYQTKRAAFSEIQKIFWIQLICEFCLFTYLLKGHLTVHLQLGLEARKPVFGCLRTTKAQTSLHIRTV